MSARPSVLTPAPAQGRAAGIALLMALLVSIYTLTSSGGFHIVDEVSLYGVSHSLLLRGEVDTNAVAWTQWTNTPGEVLGAFGPDGSVYSKKGPAPAFLGAGWLWLLALVTRLGPNWGLLQAALLWNGLLTAATAALVWLTVLRLGYGDRTGLLLGLIFGLATSAWPYATHYFGEPLSGAGLLLCFYCLLSWRHTGRRVWLWAAGGAAALVIATVTAHAPLLAVLADYGLRASPTWRSRETDLTSRVRRLLPPPGAWLPFLLPLALALLLLALYNQVRFGTPLDTGYHFDAGEGFTTPVWIGLWGLLLSPYRGVVWHVPLVVASGLAFGLFWRRHRPEALTVAAVGALLTLLYSSWWMWWGGFAWGPRFLVPLAPFWALLLAPTIEATGPQLGRPRWLWITTLLSAAVQLTAVVVNYVNYEIQLRARFPTIAAAPQLPSPPPLQGLAELPHSPVMGQLRLMAQDLVAHSDLAWLRPDGTLLWPLAAGGVGVTALLAMGLVGWWRRPATAPGGAGLGGWLAVGAAPLLLMALWLSSVAGDPRYGRGDEGYRAILAQIDAAAGPDDVVVTVAPFHYQIPMNWYRGSLPIYGYALDSMAHAQAQQVMAHLLETHPRLWFVTAGLPPAEPANSVERWLAEHAFKAGDDWYADFRLLLYATPMSLAEPRRQELDSTLRGGGQEVALLWVESVWTLDPGQVLPVRLGFRPLTAAGSDLRWFLQLLDAHGAAVALLDTAPQSGYTGFSQLLPGSLQVEQAGLPLPRQLPAGEYRLIAGLYDPAAPGAPRLRTAGGQETVTLATWILGAGE